MNEGRNHEYIEACLQCMNACNYCYVSSLKEYDLAMLKDCIRFNRECAEICSFAAAAFSRNTPFGQDIAELCATACDECAEECGKHGHEHCKLCAEACRRCASILRSFEAVS